MSGPAAGLAVGVLRRSPVGAGVGVRGGALAAGRGRRGRRQRPVLSGPARAAGEGSGGDAGKPEDGSPRRPGRHHGSPSWGDDVDQGSRPVPLCCAVWHAGPGVTSTTDDCSRSWERPMGISTPASRAGRPAPAWGARTRDPRLPGRRRRPAHAGAGSRLARRGSRLHHGDDDLVAAAREGRAAARAGGPRVRLQPRRRSRGRAHHRRRPADAQAPRDRWRPCRRARALRRGPTTRRRAAARRPARRVPARYRRRTDDGPARDRRGGAR